jgi:hypothetical protein
MALKKEKLMKTKFLLLSVLFIAGTACKGTVSLDQTTLAGENPAHINPGQYLGGSVITSPLTTVNGTAVGVLSIPRNLTVPGTPVTMTYVFEKDFDGHKANTPATEEELAKYVANKKLFNYTITFAPWKSDTVEVYHPKFNPNPKFNKNPLIAIGHQISGSTGYTTISAYFTKPIAKITNIPMNEIKLDGGTDIPDYIREVLEKVKNPNLETIGFYQNLSPGKKVIQEKIIPIEG